MVNKKSIGRPPKVDYKVMARLTDALQHGASVTKACKYAGISRDTYYRYLHSNEVFATRMQEASRKKVNLILREFSDNLLDKSL